MTSLAPLLARGRVFYGWWVIVATVIGISLGVSVLSVFAFSPFITPFGEEFGWSRGEISTAVIFSTFSFVVFSPIFGIILDRYGVRRLLILSTLLLGLLVISLYTMQGWIGQLYITYLLMPILGAGTSPLAYSKLIVHWFDKRRGLAIGLGLAGIGIGAAIVPAIAQYFIATAGWRGAYLAMGALVLIINLPLAYLFIVNTPEEVGLAPDGGVSTSRGQSQGVSGEPLGLTLRESVRTKHFLLMLGIFLLVGIATLGITAHLIPMLTDRGMSVAAATGAASTLGISLILGRILAGYLMDKFFAPYVVICFFLGPILGIGALAMGATGLLAYICVASVGVAVGAEFDVIAYFTSRYFGYRAYGQVYGWLYATFSSGGAIGPVVMGRGFDHSGTYDPYLWLLSVAIAIACVLVAFLGPYPDFTAREAKA